MHVSRAQGMPYKVLIQPAGHNSRPQLSVARHCFFKNSPAKTLESRLNDPGKNLQKNIAPRSSQRSGLKSDSHISPPSFQSFLS